MAEVKNIKEYPAFVEFFTAGELPTATAQQHRVTWAGGKPKFYDGPAVSNARALLSDLLKDFVPASPYPRGVALKLTARWFFQSKTKKPGYRVTKPDTDNLQKLLKDCMTRLGYWEDDCIVVCEQAEKFWSDYPGLYIRIDLLEDAPPEI